jgi:hypothetical protein
MLDELGDIVQGKPRFEIAEIRRRHLEGPLLSGGAPAFQPPGQRLVEDLAEGPAGAVRFGLEFGCHIVIRGQHRSHASMLKLRHHDAKQMTRHTGSRFGHLPFARAESVLYPDVGSGQSREGGTMTVLAIFKYEVKPGRFDDFMVKLQAAADPRFNSPVMPQSVRLFRSTVPGPDTGPVILVIEYPDMAAYGARTAFENANPEWKALFAVRPDSPETLLSVELLTNFGPTL